MLSRCPKGSQVHVWGPVGFVAQQAASVLGGKDPAHLATQCVGLAAGLSVSAALLLYMHRFVLSLDPRPAEEEGEGAAAAAAAAGGGR